MKAQDIKDVLDLAYRARKNGKVFNPCFVSNAGIGKSQIVQEWAREKGLPVFDLRAALIEAPEVVGYPVVTVENGRQRMSYATPDTWPDKGEGIIFIDEVNRGTTSVLNAFMQLLTDRKIFKYSLPEGWIIVAAINPENEMYDVNTMDTALRDRFVMFDVSFDKASFVQYMKDKNWNRNIIMFVESGLWTYSAPEDIGNTDGAKYIAPRTLEQLNTAMLAGFEGKEELEYNVFASILGKNVGRAFYNFIYNEYPILVGDLKNNLKKSLDMLKKYSSPENYKASYISLTIKSFVDEKVDDMELITQVLMNIPADQGRTMLQELSFVLKKDLLAEIQKNYPKVQKYFKNALT